MDIENLYQKAVTAADSGNHDYAIEIAQQILLFQPDAGKARRLLLSAATRRAKKFPKSKGSTLASGGFILALAHGFKLLKKYDKAVTNFEKFLLIDPSNSGALLGLAECCALANYSVSAIETYEFILENDPKNKYALKALGNIYSSIKNIKRAMECFEALGKVDPTDTDASKKLRDLSALELMEQKYTTDDFRSSVKDETASEALQVSEKILRSEDDIDRALTFAQAELDKNPTEVRFLLKVSDLLRRKGDFAQARKHLDRAVELNPTDPTIKMKIGDLEIFMISDSIRDAEKLPPSPERDATLVALQKKIRAFKLMEYITRVEAHPTDLNFRFTLGTLLFDDGQFDKAVSEFQQSRRDPQFRSQSLTLLGRCFIHKNMPELALKQFNEALRGLEVMDDRRKEVLYYLADAHLGMGNSADAMHLLQEILEVDINFKDVAQKIEAMRAKPSIK